MDMFANLLEALQGAESLDEVGLILTSTLGPRYAPMAWMACMVLCGIIALYVVHGFFVVLRTPAIAPGPSTKGKSGKTKGAKAPVRGIAHADGAAQASTAQPSEDDAHAVDGCGAGDDATTPDGANTATGYSLRTRSTDAEASSVIRGFSRIGVLATSPCQEYMIITCRRSGKARLYPQNNKRLFMSKGKDLQDHYFVSLDETLRRVLGIAKVDVSMVAFHGTDGSLFAIGESMTDTVVVFKTDGKKAAEVVHQWKLPKRRLVSSLGTACSLGGTQGDVLIVAHDASAEVELLHAPLPQQAAGGATLCVANSSKAHFSIGHALTWSLAYPIVAVGGSFMKEARMATVLPRNDLSDFSLKGSFVAPVERAECATTDAAERRVCAAVGLISKHQPEFNQRAYLVVFMASGEGYVYDVSGDERPDIVLRGRFTDTDYATNALSSDGHNTSVIPVTGGRSSVVGMSLAVSGTAFHERLRIALWTTRDVAVYAQRDEYNYSNQEPFVMTRLMDIHDASTASLQSVVFVQHGLGLATCGSHDDNLIRLWTLPE